MPVRLYDIHINFKVHQQLDLCNTRFRVPPPLVPLSQEFPIKTFNSPGGYHQAQALISLLGQQREKAWTQHLYYHHH